MKDALKRMLGMSPAAPAAAEDLPKDVTMNVVEDGTNVAAPDAGTVDVASLQASVAELTGQLSAALAREAELTELVAKATEFQADLVKQAAEAKSASRLAALATTLGDEAAATMNASLASLSDEAFSGVLASLGAKSVAEAATPLFKEVGVDGEVDTKKLADETKGSVVMDYLTAKYPVK